MKNQAKQQRKLDVGVVVVTKKKFFTNRLMLTN